MCVCVSLVLFVCFNVFTGFICHPQNGVDGPCCMNGQLKKGHTVSYVIQNDAEVFTDKITLITCSTPGRWTVKLLSGVCLHTSQNVQLKVLEPFEHKVLTSCDMCDVFI